MNHDSTMNDLQRSEKKLKESVKMMNEAKMEHEQVKFELA